MDPIAEPRLLIHRARTRANIRRMAVKAADSEVRLRPHFKTHQSREIGRWFRDEGTRAITVSSPSMLEYFADDGWDDITIAIPLNPAAAGSYRRFVAKGGKLGLITDSVEAVERLPDFGDFDLWIEIDSGDGRTGVPWEDVATARAIADACHGKVRGILTHRGGSYASRSVDEVRSIFAECVRRMNLMRDGLGIDGLEVSVGDTPGCTLSETFDGVDEIRPGNYVYYDVMQLDLGVCSAKDIALGVACPVISKHGERGEVIVHGGAVHLSRDSVPWKEGGPCFGRVLDLGEGDQWGGVIPHAHVRSISQEHGIISADSEWIDALAIGEPLVILPVHSCLAMDALKPDFDVV